MELSKKLKRGYLNVEERNFYMVAKAFIQYIEGERNLENKRTNEVWIEWERRGMISTEMSKNLKLVRTYLKKFCYELEENLDDSEKKRLSKQIMRFDYKLIDDYTFKKILRDIENKMKYVVMEREKFIEIVEDIAQVRCVGCTKDYKGCCIHTALEDINTPYLGEEPNCPYACNLELKENDKERVEKIKARLRKNNKFYKG